MNTRVHLLDRISDYLTQTGQTERQFGLAVTGDHKWVARLRSGKVSLRSIERAEAIIAEPGAETGLCVHSAEAV
jgi:ligand-binding sensor domain-containing protein